MSFEGYTEVHQGDKGQRQNMQKQTGRKRLRRGVFREQQPGWSSEGGGSKSQTNALYSNGRMCAPNRSLSSVLPAYCIAIPVQVQEFAWLSYGLSMHTSMSLKYFL